MFKVFSFLGLSFALSTPGLAQTSPASLSTQSPAQEISQIWQIRQKLKTPSDSVVEKQLDAILALQKKYRLESILSITGLLLNEVQVSPSSSSENEKKISYARAFSEKTSLVDHFLCRRSFSLGSIHACMDAFQKDWSTSEGRLRIASNASTSALYALTLMACMILLLAVLKHAETLALYAEYRSPTFPRWAYFSILVFTAFAAWTYFGAIGIFWFAILFLCRFLDHGERLTFATLLFFMLTIPWIFTSHANRIIYETGIAPILESPYADYDLENRITSLEAHVRIHPKDAHAQLTLAGLYQRLQRQEKSTAWLEKAAATDPKWHKPWINLAVSKYADGHVQAAIDDLKKAAQINPRSVYAQFNLGKALIHETRLEEAQVALKKAKDLDSQVFEELESQSKAGGDLSLIEEGLDTTELESTIYPAHTQRLGEIRTAIFAQSFSKTPLTTFLLVNLFLILFLLASLSGKVFPLPEAFLQLIRQNSVDSMQPTDILNPLTAKTNLKSFNFLSSLIHRIQHAWITFLVPGGPFYFHAQYFWSFLTMAISCALLAPFLSSHLALRPPLEIFQAATDPWAFASFAVFLIFYATLGYGWVKHGA